MVIPRQFKNPQSVNLVATNIATFTFAVAHTVFTTPAN